MSAVDLAERVPLDEIRSANRALLLRLAAAAGTTSCPALARESGLSRATVYIIAEELERAGVLVPGGIGDSSGGRRPELLRFAPRAWASIGVELDEREVHALMTDLTGTPIARETEPLRGRSPAATVDAVAAAVERLALHVPSERILGLGVATPGIVDQGAGVVRLSVAHEWTDVPLAAILRERTGLRTYVASRSMAAALGEYRAGAGQGARHLIYLYAGQVLGAGIVVEGEPHTGAPQSSSAGQIGHITVEPDGALCDCGNRGCLHTVASGRVLVAKARAALREHPEAGAVLRRRGGPDQSLLRTIDLAEAAAAGDTIAAPLVAGAGRAIGLAAATVINLFGPDRLILGGPLTAAGPVFLDAVYAEARRRALAIPLAAVQFAPSALGDDSAAFGAAGLVLRHAADLMVGSRR